MKTKNKKIKSPTGLCYCPPIKYPNWCYSQDHVDSVFSYSNDLMYAIYMTIEKLKIKDSQKQLFISSIGKLDFELLKYYFDTEKKFKKEFGLDNKTKKIKKSKEKKWK